MKKIVSLILVGIIVLIGIGSGSPFAQNIFIDEYDMVIISPEEFTEALQPLINHKLSVDVETLLKTTEEVYLEYPGHDKAEQIKYCIKDMIETYDIKYVLLVGGHEGQLFQWHVPVRIVHLADGARYTEFVSDLYFADVFREDGSFDDWNSNNDDIIAEWGKDTFDLIPDVSVGRLPCRNQGEVTTVVSKIIEYNIKASSNQPESMSAWENVKGNIELVFEPHATCEDLIPIFTKKFEETPDDVELLNKITDMLDKKDCTDSDLFFQASVKLNQLQPTPHSSFMIAKMLMKKDKYDEAVSYLEGALEIDDADAQADAFILLATIYRQKHNFPKARSYALSTLDLRPDDGNAYLIIGDMYAASASECGDNDLTKKTAYWAAIDKYKKAKSVDPGVGDIADKRIEIYSKQFPNSETIFFYDLSEGESYKVECWINETTTVRALK